MQLKEGKEEEFKGNEQLIERKEEEKPFDNGSV